MSVYGENIVLESVLLEAGLSKDDITDKTKVMNAIKEVEKKGGPIEALRVALACISLLVVAFLTVKFWYVLPIFITVCITIVTLLDKVETSKKNKEIDKVLKELNKTLQKLEKQREKETDPKKQKELDKAIAEVKKQIAAIEKKKVNQNIEHDLKNELQMIKQVVGKSIIDADDIYLLSLWFHYYNISQQELDSLMNKYAEDDNNLIDYFEAEEDSDIKEGINSYNYLKDNKLLGTKWVYFEMIDDTYLIYSCTKKKFYYGGIAPGKGIESSKIMNMIDIKKYIEKDNDYDKLIKADAYLGYYKLSNPTKGVTPKPVPDYKK